MKAGDLRDCINSLNSVEEKVETASRYGQRVIVVNGSLAHVSSSYDAELVEEIKALDTRRFNRDQKVWSVGQDSWRGLSRIAEQYDFLVCGDLSANIKVEHLFVENNLFVLKTPYCPEALGSIRDISGRKWDKQSKVNTFPSSTVAAKGLRGLCKQFGWNESDEASCRIDELLGKAERMLGNSRAISADVDIEGFGSDSLKLRPFQAAGVEYAIDSGCRTFIADEMGLGKTIQALAVIQREKAFPALVICPKAVRLNWVQEAERWLPGVSVGYSKGRKLPDTDILIVNYDVVVKLKQDLIDRGFQAIVLDESHYIKSKKAQRTKAIAGYWDKDRREHVPGIVDNIRVRLALSGTVVMNRPSELVSQLEFLGRMQEFGKSWDFLQRYCDATETRFGWDFSGASNLTELSERLRSTCYIRREKAVVARELPPLQRSIVPVEIKHRREYEARLRDVISWMRTYWDSRTEEDTEASYRAQALVRIEGLKQLVAQHKMDSVVDWVVNYLSVTDDGKLVLFAHHRAIQDALFENLREFNPAKIKGGDSDDERERNIVKFRSDDSCRVIVASIKAASVGINLQNASAVAFAEFGWTPAEHDQAEARVHRIGSNHESINAYWLVAKGTFDDDCVDLIESKRAIVDAINSDSGDIKRGQDIVSWFEDLMIPNDMDEQNA